MKLGSWSSALLGICIVASQCLSPQTATAQVEKLYECVELPDDTERLACYDQQARDLRASISSGAITLIDEAEIEKIERDSFGLPRVSLSRLLGRSDNAKETAGAELTERLDEIEAPIAQASISKLTGRVLLTLTNGQVWEQTDSARIGLSVVKGAKIARITSAALGSFFIQIDGKTKFRAKRIE